MMMILNCSSHSIHLTLIPALLTDYVLALDDNLSQTLYPYILDIKMQYCKVIF